MRAGDIPPAEFEQIVADAFIELPEWVREAVHDVAIVVEDDPPPQHRPAHGTLLGLYHGVPRTRRGDRVPGSMPDTISIYRRPILMVCRTRPQVVAKVASVLRHEIGHALGLDEAKLRELGVG